MSLFMSTIGCDSFSYLRRVSDRLLDENFGRQRYHSESQTLAFFFKDHLSQFGFFLDI